MVLSMIVLIVLLIGIDQFTKYLAVIYLKDGSSVTLVRNFFELTYVENTGAAFGIFQGAKWFFIILAFIFTIALIYFNFVILPRDKFRLMHFAVSMVTAGGVGNLIDRIRHGYVVDFFYFHIADAFHWPVFNIADTVVVVGTFLLAACLLFQKELWEEKKVV